MGVSNQRYDDDWSDSEVFYVLRRVVLCLTFLCILFPGNRMLVVVRIKKRNSTDVLIKSRVNYCKINDPRCG